MGLVEPLVQLGRLGEQLLDAAMPEPVGADDHCDRRAVPVIVTSSPRWTRSTMSASVARRR